MNARDQADFVADGHSAARRAQFQAGDAAGRDWERAHPMSLADYLDFLDDLQAIVGAFPTRTDPWRGADFRL